MNTYYLIDTSIIICFFLIIFSLYFNRFLQKKIDLFKALKITAFLIIICLISSPIIKIIDERTISLTQSSNFILTLLMFFLFTGRVLYPIAWTLFLKTYLSRRQTIPLKKVLLNSILSQIFIVLLITSPLTNLVFSIGSENNIIKQGALYNFPLYINIVYFLFCLGYTIYSKKHLSSSEYLVFLFVSLISVVGSFSELLFPEVTFTISAIAISVLFTYILLQDNLIKYDSKTGIWNRKAFDTYLDTKHSENKINYSFAYVAIDNYEQIRLRYGENEQELAVVGFANILKKCIFNKDIIVYYQNNEFGIYFNTTDMTYILEKFKEIDTALINYNKKENKPYNLKYSYGLQRYNNSYKNNRNIEKDAYILMYEKQVNAKEKD